MKKKALVLPLLCSLVFGATLASCGDTSEASSNAADNQLSIYISATEIYVGETATISVTDPSGNAMSDITYDIGDESVISISGNTITGLAAGTSTVKAKKAGYKAAEGTITVVQDPSTAADDSGGIRGGTAPTGAAVATLEFEYAEHYSLTDQWGSSYNGYYDSPIENTDTASNGQSIGFFNTGCTETITFTSDSASTTTLGFSLASCAFDWTTWGVGEQVVADYLSISVNGTALDIGSRKLPGNSNYNYYNWYEIYFNNVDIVSGENTIVVTALQDSSPNLDCVYVYDTSATIEQVTASNTTVSYTSIGTYDYLVGGYEWGPGVYAMVVDLGEGNTISASDLTVSNFTCSVSSASYSGSRNIEDIYLSDTDGNAIDATSGTVFTVELELHCTSMYYDYSAWGWGAWWSTSYDGSSPFYYDSMSGYNYWDDTYALTLKQAKGTSITVGSTTYDGVETGLQIDTVGEKVITAVEDWSEAGSYTYDGINLTYKSWGEKTGLANDGGKNPLVIWLHGAGEGGTDPDIAILGNDVTNLAEEQIQSHFKTDTIDGAYVLAVQTPTQWMDDGSGTTTSAEKSYYTDALMETIKNYVNNNSDIDTDRIILGGCSNGGYMTINMAKYYGDYFSAYYPVCEAYSNDNLSDSDIAALARYNIWLTASADDTTVDPTSYSSTLYTRLIAAGAENVHYSLFDGVIGNDTGEAINYMGHWSWIYVFHDEVALDQKAGVTSTDDIAISTEKVYLNGEEVGLFEWLANI